MDDPSKKRPGTPDEILTDWLNQMLREICNDEVIRQFWSAVNVGGRDGYQTGVDPYRILGLDKTAAADQVKKRYRALMVKLHPDTAGVQGTEFLFQLVLAAYQQISRARGWQK